MYLRETRQKRTDGSVVTHLQSAESVWHPRTKRSEGFCRKFCSGGPAGAVAPVCGEASAASAAHGAAAVRPSWPAAPPSGRGWSRGRRARPPRVAGAAANAGPPPRGRGFRGPPRCSWAPRWLSAVPCRRALAGPGASGSLLRAAVGAALPALGRGAGPPASGRSAPRPARGPPRGRAPGSPARPGARGPPPGAGAGGRPRPPGAALARPSAGGAPGRSAPRAPPGGLRQAGRSRETPQTSARPSRGEPGGHGPLGHCAPSSPSPMMHGWAWRESRPHMASNENLRQNPTELRCAGRGWSKESKGHAREGVRTVIRHVG
jgi:hypothetical protein